MPPDALSSYSSLPVMRKLTAPTVSLVRRISLLHICCYLIHFLVSFFFFVSVCFVCVFVVVRKIDEQIRELSAAVGKLALLADALAAVFPAARAPQMPPPLAAVLAAARGGGAAVEVAATDAAPSSDRVTKAHGAAEPSAALAAEWNPANIQTASVSAPAAIAAVAAAAAAAGFANAVELRDDHDTDALLLDDDDATTTANLAETDITASFEDYGDTL